MSIKKFKQVISISVVVLMLVGVFTSCAKGQQGMQGTNGDKGEQGAQSVMGGNGDKGEQDIQGVTGENDTDNTESTGGTKQPSVETPGIGDSAENDAKEKAKIAVNQYLAQNNNELPKYMLYNADGKWVTIHNGTAVGVYVSKEEALKAMVGENNADISLLTQINSNLSVYRGELSDNSSEKFAVSYVGKKISILGDSISTYGGISNNSTYNSTLGNNAVYYQAGALDGQQSTWWQQVIDTLGMSLCVNNSWSGSCILKRRSGTDGAYLDRCVQLHNDHTNEEPDVIAIFLGTNDFSYYQETLGTSEIDYAALIVAKNDGTFTYATPKTSCEAYAIMLHKITVRYPDAKIFCMSLLPRRAEDYSGDSVKDPGIQPTAFNEELAKIATRFGCTVVDLEHCGITPELSVFDSCIADRRVHPNVLGMDRMTEAVINTMMGKDFKSHSITTNYVGTICDNHANIAFDGQAYIANITLKSGYQNLSVTVTMAGRDITTTCYKKGQIYIPSVDGDIVIQATAVKTTS